MSGEQISAANVPRLEQSGAAAPPRHLTIVVPAFNEARHIGTTLAVVTEAADRLLDDYEIIVVDDGSTDGTCESATQFAAGHPRVAVHRQPTNKGVGAAYLHGLALARFPYLTLIPGDNAFSKAAIENIFTAVGTAPLVVSYRNMEARTPLRLVLSVICTLLMQIISGKGIRDAQSMYVYPVELARRIKVQPGYGYHIESLGRLLHMASHYVQVPAPLNPRPDANSGVMRLKVVWLLAMTMMRLGLWRAGQVFTRRPSAQAPGSRIQPRLSISGELTALALISTALTLVYLPTFIYPYLLTDELWIVRPETYSWAFGLGRYLFGYIGWVEGEIFKLVGLDVIYVKRAVAVLGLSATAYLLMRWFETWSHRRFTALPLALAIVSLPAYQIIVADGTQLALALPLVAAATFLSFQYGRDRPILICLVASILLLTALLIYQQMVLVAFGMLVVPLLSGRSEQKPMRFAVAYGSLVAAVSVIYFVAWQIAYGLTFGDRVDTRYGPDAVSLPAWDQLNAFLYVRLIQIGNLWSVENGQASWIILFVYGLVVAKIVADLQSSYKGGVIATLMTLGVFVASDSFAILTRASGSYVTAPALSIVVFYWAFAGIEAWGARFASAAAVVLALVGSVCAHLTVRNDVAIPNWREIQTIRAAFLENPDAEGFHLLGSEQQGPKYGEFSWRNSATDVYLHLAALDVADDLVLRNLMSPAKRLQKHVTVGRVITKSNPTGDLWNRRKNSIVVDVPDAATNHTDQQLVPAYVGRPDSPS